MNASPRSDFAPAEPHRGRAALNAAGSAINTGCPAPAINPTTSPSPRSIAIGNILTLVEKRHKLLTGVRNQPSFDDRTAIVDHAHPVMCRTPIPSAEHLLTSKSDIAAGAGPTVGSSLFGPRWGSSLAPITRPGNDKGDQLKQAIKWRGIEAVPRHSRQTGQHDPHPHTHPMRQRAASRGVFPSAVRFST